MALQKKCVSGVTHQKYRLGVIKRMVREVEVSPGNRWAGGDRGEVGVKYIGVKEEKRGVK